MVSWFCEVRVGEPQGQVWLDLGRTLPRQVQCRAWGRGGAMPPGDPAGWTQAVGAWEEGPVPGPSDAQDARQPGSPTLLRSGPCSSWSFFSQSLTFTVPTLVCVGVGGGR